MLTVKYIDQRGIEEIFPCERVVYCPDLADAVSFKAAGLYLDVDCEFDDSGEYPISAKHVFPFCRVGGAGLIRPRAYVMNDRGATVATYEL